MYRVWSTQELLDTIKVNIHAFLKAFHRHVPGTLSEQYTKTGPGRKAKNGKQRYLPRQQENASWYFLHMPRYKRAIQEALE